MPRNGKGRGGARQGSAGTAYTNRTDLAADRAPDQPAQAKAGQTYGERGRQEQAMQALPLPDLAATVAALPALDAPTARPDEPLTAGLPFGPGPGPISRRPESGAAALLRAMVAADPDPELFELLAEAERGP